MIFRFQFLGGMYKVVNVSISVFMHDNPYVLLGTYVCCTNCWKFLIGQLWEHLKFQLVTSASSKNNGAANHTLPCFFFNVTILAQASIKVNVPRQHNQWHHSYHINIVCAAVSAMTLAAFTLLSRCLNNIWSVCNYRMMERYDKLKFWCLALFTSSMELNAN